MEPILALAGLVLVGGLILVGRRIRPSLAGWIAGGLVLLASLPLAAWIGLVTLLLGGCGHTLPAGTGNLIAIVTAAVWLGTAAGVNVLALRRGSTVLWGSSLAAATLAAALVAWAWLGAYPAESQHCFY